MLNRFATLATVCLLVPIAAAPLAVADPPPDSGAVPSGAPGITTTPDGWTLTVSATNETQLAVPPLTTAVSSREYLVGGTFTGSAKGSGPKRTGGTLEAGYQIGCGVNLQTIELNIGGFGVTAGFGAAGLTSVRPEAGGNIEINLGSGKVATVPVDTKEFKSGDPRITVSGQRIKVDGCVGSSFLRSYATFTSTSDNNDNVVSYVGVTKEV